MGYDFKRQRILLKFRGRKSGQAVAGPTTTALLIPQSDALTTRPLRHCTILTSGINLSDAVSLDGAYDGPGASPVRLQSHVIVAVGATQRRRLFMRKA